MRKCYADIFSYELCLKKILLTAIFGVFFGMLEAIVVVYLRQIFGVGSTLVNHSVSQSEIQWSLLFIAFLKPESSLLVIANQKLLQLELWRELATIVMLGAFGFVAGNRLREKLAYFFLSFAIWDIFYYVFLRVFTGWPQRLFDLDVFFLIPVVWVGPVITPLIISSILVIVSIFVLIRMEKKK